MPTTKQSRETLLGFCVTPSLFTHLEMELITIVNYTFCCDHNRLFNIYHDKDVHGHCSCNCTCCGITHISHYECISRRSQIYRTHIMLCTQLHHYKHRQPLYDHCLVWSFQVVTAGQDDSLLHPPATLFHLQAVRLPHAALRRRVCIPRPVIRRTRTLRKHR